jgi:hypothetical protein
MLFDSSFSFAPKSLLPESTSERSNVQRRKVVGAVSNRHSSTPDHDLPLSPHSRTNLSGESPGFLRPPSFFSPIKPGDHPVWPIPPRSTSPVSSAPPAVSPDRPLSTSSSTRSSVSIDNSDLTMKFFTGRRHGSHKHFGDPVIESALTMDIASLKSQERPRTISVPARVKNRRSESRIPDFPEAPKASKRKQERPPMLKLDQCPSTQPVRIERSQAIDDNLLSPFTRPSPPRTTHSANRHSQTAEFFGIQMLLNTFDEDSEDSDDQPEEPVPQLVPPQAQSSVSRPLRLETAMPSIEERGETSSETSSMIDSLGPATPISFRWDRRFSTQSTTSTTPTSISEFSLGGSSKFSKSLKRRSGASSKRYSFNSDDFSAIPEEPSASKPRGLSEAESAASRRSSTATFFCRGARDSFGTHGRRSIGLGSIAASDIDLEAGLENSTHFPGVEELKKQISWLALRGTQIYDSDEEEEEEEEIDPSEDYHQLLASMVQESGSTSSRRTSAAVPAVSLFPLPPTAAAQTVPTGPPLQDPPPRRNRRRTASSECVVLETLENMRIADGKASYSLERLKSLSKHKQQLSPKQLPAKADIIDEAFWDSSSIGDTTVWDRMLGFKP